MVMVNNPIGLGQRDILLENMGETLDKALEYRHNKDKAYSEGFQEFINNSVDINILGVDYKVHPNVNFYVDMTKKCSCNCKFCIAKVGFKRELNFENGLPEYFDKGLRLLKNANPSIQITGGEPTVYPEQLQKLINVAELNNCRNPVLNTNGYNLGGVDTHFIKHINISRHHYNEKINQEIMLGIVPSNEKLSETINKVGADKVRVQCNLIGDYIDTYGEVMQFIAYCYHKLGVRNIAFAGLTPLPDDSFYNLAIIDYVRNHPVDIDKILSSIDVDSRFTFKKYRGGVACYYEVWEYNAYDDPVTVIFKYSDNNWLEKVDMIPNLIPDFVLHTDGTLCGSWCRDRKVIATKNDFSSSILM